jgi:drug/metabolite transporter (DMT)-like permease
VETVALLPFARPRAAESLAAASVSEVALILFLGLASTLGAYLAWTKVLEAVGPAQSAVFVNAVPPLAVVIAALTIGETITPWFAAGGGLIVGGAMLAQWGGRLSARPRWSARPAYAAASSSISGE